MISCCIFCESQFADPIPPACRQKICILFDVTFHGKKLLHDEKICTRCLIQVDLIDNAIKLKADMNQCLQDKLRKNESLLQNNGVNSLILPPEEPNKNASPPTSNHSSKADEILSPSVVNSADLLMPSSLGAPLNPRSSSILPNSISFPALPQLANLQERMAQHLSLPLLANDGVFMCIHCGKAFKEHVDLVTHDLQCRKTQTSPVTLGCERCGQSLKYRSNEDRMKHVLQCQGQGLRRGRPSVGITSCPKCGLSLKNRMNHDRVNHVERCNGNGLKRGRPSLKADEKFKCEKCGRNLWSRDQLQLHIEKCDGSHIERRGRKPGDNICMVCGENLVYRHILKKHLRQSHGINPQNLDDSVIAAVRNEQAAEELSTPYKRLLLNQIQQRLTTSLPNEDLVGQSDNQDECEGYEINPNYESAFNHRKKAKPMKVMPSADAYGGANYQFGNNASQDDDYYDNQSSAQSDDSDADDHQGSMVIDERDYEENSSEEMESSNNHLTQSHKSEMEGKKLAGDVDDVVSAISARAEIKQQKSNGVGSKGNTIAQVISDLILASKNGPTPMANPNSLTGPVRQSISI